MVIYVVSVRDSLKMSRNLIDLFCLFGLLTVVCINSVLIVVKGNVAESIRV